MFSVCGRYLLALMLLVSVDTALSSEESIVIMIGVDGMRADTLERMPAPNLKLLADSGVVANMIPAMPTKTFVNFYSLATGLHPKNHGMISNYPYDRKLGRKFNRKEDAADPRWWGGEPIWITAEKQGVVTATYFRVGSEVEIAGIRPSFWKPYQKHKDYSERIDETLGWLALPKGERPSLVLLYFSAVDTAAHHFGVGSKEEKQAVAKIDKHIGDLITGLNQLGLTNRSNIVVVADHGMANLSDERVINLDPHIDLSEFIVPDWASNSPSVFAPFLNLYIAPNLVDEAFKKLNGAHSNMRVLRRGAFPKDYHFNHPDREPDLMLLADSGWSLYASRDNSYPQSMQKTGRSVATHGYDNRDPLMQAAFIANGPAFKKNFRGKPFDNIEIYGLLACILGIQAANTDGNISSLQYLMTKECSP